MPLYKVKVKVRKIVEYNAIYFVEAKSGKDAEEKAENSLQYDESAFPGTLKEWTTVEPFPGMVEHHKPL